MLQQFIRQSSSPLNNNINTAVILAAGRGERIAGGEEYRSKPLIKLYDLSLIERSIKKIVQEFDSEKSVTTSVPDSIWDFLLIKNSTTGITSCAFAYFFLGNLVFLNFL